ncbi:T9SS type A sorting domain-containing protein [Pontibacter sp. KCTC 32443]|uniref:M43 family zinc metalloprotease n=1 Tax=Pontibacter TaxID=323449 RepID=UPI00164DF018|nr:MULTISPECIES: M43 family zinc metalloprotease [Pontibacter]MBC5775692.1 T9SS type A sorting domain-containing protein [Pontibacter sp. KCTC 32443]
MRFTTPLWLLLLLCLAMPGYSQVAPASKPKGRTCATDQYQELLEQEQPGIKLQQQKAKEAALQYINRQSEGKALRKATTITIPVVFHVLYNTPEQNISDEQIYSQLAVLNADFRRTNEDKINTPSHFAALAGDANIEFCLASTDPNGELSNGITRTQTATTSFSVSNSRIKRSANGGADAWDRDQYLNIWVGNIGDNILGWATFPGVMTSPQNDGVVLHYQTVGAAPYNTTNWQYNRGRTATHEIGHWLGLQHIWGEASASCNDSDDIEDTPNQYKPNYECPSGIMLSCGNGPYGDMWQNYMDYSDDACMNLFTNGQIAYMTAVLNSSRSKLLISVACTGGLRADFETATDTLIQAGETVAFKDKSVGVKPTSWLWEFEGGTPALSTERNPIVTYKAPGKYKVKLTIANSEMSSTETKSQFVEVTSNELVVYPIPASDYILLEQPAHVELKHVELIDRVGKVMLSQEVSTRKAELNTQGLPAGIYFLRISGSTGVETKKITILR